MIYASQLKFKLMLREAHHETFALPTRPLVPARLYVHKAAAGETISLTLGDRDAIVMIKSQPRRQCFREPINTGGFGGVALTPRWPACLLAGPNEETDEEGSPVY